eukprot:SAG25_NODE_189_length_12334_cov_8.994279_5_plen_54_part_00
MFLQVRRTGRALRGRRARRLCELYPRSLVLPTRPLPLPPLLLLPLPLLPRRSV